MNYEFALDKKAAISLIACLVVIATLLFVAGWVVGRQWPMSESAAKSSAATEEQRAELPKEPVLNEVAAETNAPKKVKPKVEPPAEAEGISPQAGPTAAAAPAAAAAAAAPGKDDGIIIISEAEPEVDQAQAAAEPEYVTVQVGVFLDEKDASRLLKEIESKGYSPTFFSGRDTEARQWYAVRIGRYSDKQQAENAAANFTKQEKIKAVVRPAESL